MKLKLILKMLLITLFSISSWAFDHSHSDWQKVLDQAVVDKGFESQVDYKKVKASPAKLNVYLKVLEKLTKKEFKSFSKQQRLAVLINAYNAYTVKLIVDNYPLKSIRDIKKFSFSNPTASPWKIKFFTFLGDKTHLDNIEHDMIRKDFNEPRIHFAVVCASIGCPALAKEAFTASNMNTLLDKNSTRFFSDKTRNVYLPNKKQVHLSKLLDWYGDDFRKNGNTLEDFVAKHITKDPAAQSLIRSKKAPISFPDTLKYDWNLNEVK